MAPFVSSGNSIVLRPAFVKASSKRHIHHEAHEVHEVYENNLYSSDLLYLRELRGCPLPSSVQLRRAVPCLNIKIHFVAFVSFVVKFYFFFPPSLKESDGAN